MLPASTTRWFVRFGYDGAAFHGWARQPGLRTVEGEIRRGLVRKGVGPSLEAAELEVASRTDRGVSAVGNVLAVTSPRTGPVLLRSLNGMAEDLFFTAATPAPEGLRVRAATSRVYRYFEPADDWDLDRWRATARLFSGEIDVRSLGRGLAPEVPVRRSVDVVRVDRSGPVFSIEIRARSFVWGMVRKIVAALREVDRGRLSPARLAAALAGTERLTLPLAEPGPLVLWEVQYGIPWQFAWSGPNRHQAQARRAADRALVARREVLRALDEAEGRPSDSRSRAAERRD